MYTDRSLPIVLGTVQLGQSYGIANKTGRPDQAHVTDIIQTAWSRGIREFDTAQDYGQSEKMLGIAFARLGISSKARVISKIDPALNHCDAAVMARALESSLERLGVEALYGLMLHKESLLSELPRGLGNILRSFVRSGKVKKIGVSVYSPEAALGSLSVQGLDMVQVPANMLDRRFQAKGVFDRASEAKRQVYIRSVFLQGLILMDPRDLPADMTFALPVLEKINSLSEELNVTKLELALGYIKARYPEAKLIIGVETVEQLKSDLECWEKSTMNGLIPLVENYFETVEDRIVNPSLWKR